MYDSDSGSGSDERCSLLGRAQQTGKYKASSGGNKSKFAHLNKGEKKKPVPIKERDLKTLLWLRQKQKMLEDAEHEVYTDEIVNRSSALTAKAKEATRGLLRTRGLQSR